MGIGKPVYAAHQMFDPGLSKGEITQLKRVYPLTPIIVDGKAVTAIVCPKESAVLRQQAARLANILEKCGGTSIDIVDVDDMVSADWQLNSAAMARPSLIALGNINNNRFLAVLFGQKYVIADSVYPGKGGHVVRTVHDPFGKGVNVLVLAGSDVVGVGRAIDVLAKKYLSHETGNVFLSEPVVDVEFERVQMRFLPGPVPAEQAKRQPQYRTAEYFMKLILDENGQVKRFETESVGSVIDTLSQMAQSHFWNGDPELPPLMKAVLDANRQCLNAAPKKRIEMEGGMSARNLHAWDLVEELPVFSDEDRLTITNAFLRDSRVGHEKRRVHSLVREGYIQVMGENHDVFAGANDFAAWNYFHKYYELPESQYWMDVARATYLGQCATHEILEDAAGYLDYIPNVTVNQAMASRDLRYLDLGIARTQAEYTAQVVFNNLGLSTGFGDTSELIMHVAGAIVSKAAWYYKDPRLTWIYQNLIPVEAANNAWASAVPYDLTIEPREPVEWTGMSIFPLYKTPFPMRQASKMYHYAPAESVGPEWFNKIVFREAWKKEAQYLILDGAGMWLGQPQINGKSWPHGPVGHMHNDGNTIINFTDEGRMWLVDHTRGNKAINDHSGLCITRDARSSYQCHPVRILDQAEGGDLAFVHTLFEDYSDADWQRSIFWHKGDYFVAIDRVVAQMQGNFSARCSFRGLGEMSLSDSSLRLTQRGKFCDIVSDGEGTLDVEEFLFDNPDEWKMNYPHAEPVVKVFQQDKSKRLAPGQSFAFHTLIKASNSAADLDTTTMRIVSEGAVIIRSRNEQGMPEEILYGVGTPPGNVAKARAFAVSADRLLLSGLTRLGDAKDPLIEADMPISLYLSKGSMPTIYSPDAVTINAKSTPVLEAATESLAAAILTAAHELADRRESDTIDATHESKTFGKALQTTSIRLDSGISDAKMADIDSDGVNEWLVADSEGVSSYNDRGKLLWRFPMEKPGSVLDVGDIDGDGTLEIVAGCENFKVYCLDADGTEQWNFLCKPCDIATGPPVPDAIRIDDLEGDGVMDIVVGATWVHCLQPDGQVKWEDYFQLFRGLKRGDLRELTIADLNNDGSRDVVAAFYMNYSHVIIFDADGSVVYPFERDRQQRQGFKIKSPQCVVATNLFGGKELQHILVGSNARLSAFWASGPSAGQRTEVMDGSVTHLIEHRPSKGRPIYIAGTEMGGLIATRAYEPSENGQLPMETVWTTVVGQKIRSLWTGTTTKGASPVLFVGTKSGALFAFNPTDGSAIGSTIATGSPVVKILDCIPGLLALHKDGTVETLSLNW